MLQKKNILHTKNPTSLRLSIGYDKEGLLRVKLFWQFTVRRSTAKKNKFLEKPSFSAIYKFAEAQGFSYTKFFFAADPAAGARAIKELVRCFFSAAFLMSPRDTV